MLWGGDRRPRYRSDGVSRATLARIVAATGQIGPREKAEVGSQISGIVRSVEVVLGAPVREGQLLARLDPATYAAAVREAEIHLANARASDDAAERRATQAEALKADGLIPVTEYDKALNERQQATGARELSQAAHERARIDLERCDIRAPIAGVVTSRHVSVGQSVSPSSGELPLFTIAADLTKMQIEANVVEADVGSVGIGHRASFTVDAFPDREFDGIVAEILGAATTDQGIVFYPTIIHIENPDLLLRLGMTANVSIVVESHEEVLTIANAALRFKPPEEVAEGEPGSSSGDAANGRSEKAAETHVVYRLRSAGPERGTLAPSLEPVRVTAGFSDGRRTQVIAGLEEGDKIVVAVEKTKKGETGLLTRIRDLLAGRSKDR